MKVRYLTEEIIFATGTPEGTFDKEIDPDTNLDLIDGVQVHEISNGGINSYSIGIEDKNAVYCSLVHKNDYMSSVSSPINERYKQVMIPVIKGNKIRVKTNIPAPLQSELRYQIVFRHKTKN
jgi:L-rhamnose mutarotase